ncbi:glycoside hydrolase [Bisporella sp. PMI_857]|nr:glycoside hydrolase [Bisporella sp. PMI_857]
MLTKRYLPLYIVFILFAYFVLFPSRPQPVSLNLQHPFSDTFTSPTNGKGGGFNWRDRKEDYPVASIIPLPTGSPKPIPKIQYDFGPENATRTAEIRSRRDAVQKAFDRSWEGYKNKAWMKDELLPISGGSRNTFGGWAATLVDSLDTLWIMGKKTDFEQAVANIKDIDFSTTEAEEINTFETTIRYLGGLLAAHDLTDGRYPALLDKALELGHLLYAAFDTPNRMPITRWHWQKVKEGKLQKSDTGILVAEIGSLSLEFTRLSQVSGDLKFYDAIQRIADKFEKTQPHTKLPGMWPVVINPTRDDFGDDAGFSLGAMADSVYEYLPKQYMLLGGVLDQPKKLYEAAIEIAKKELFFRPMVPDEADILISGNVRVSKDKITNDGQGQHLACFIGGMMGVASRIFDRPEDLSIARKLTDGCIWAYNAMPSGIMPETFNAIVCGNATSCHYDQHHPDNTLLHPGFAALSDKRYILRPEAIESILILYRVTGDENLRDHAWTMFQAIEHHTATRYGNTALNDVSKDTPPKIDRMESFWTAETLKYFYLVFSSPDLISLDQYVFNTEAHPFSRPS